MVKETLFLVSDSSLHDPQYEFWNGYRDPHPDRPERETAIKQALTREGHLLEESATLVPNEVLYEIHDPDYVEYMQQACASLEEDQAQYPSAFPIRASESKPTNQLALHGYYCFDTYTPLLRHTYEAALRSASLSWTLALAIANDHLRFGYALCRPPGHHAEHSQMGGYCYLNNAAVAVEYLSQHGKVATLDVDYHHGNGTQHLFYSRDDVLTTSIHSDPTLRFPNMSGFESEIGKDQGRGFNRNFVLSDDTSNERYQYTLGLALEGIALFVPDFLIVSFGADTHKDDSYEGFQLTTDYYAQMARTIAQLKLPTIVVQEGGYNSGILGDNVASFLRGFLS